MRRKVVAGNWKMNLTPSQAKALVDEFRPHIDNPEVDVILCVPAIDIIPVSQELAGTGVHIGAENMYYEEKGAYTGEVSAPMLKSIGVEYVILGHSERRQYFNEDDRVINKKIRKALEHDITPIICCGETIEQREAGITLEFIRIQIVNAFAQVSKEDAKKTLNKNLEIKSEGLAIIPTEYKTEILCWEFKGTVDDTDFLVYINAETGKEEDILTIVNTPNGTLTM